MDDPIRMAAFQWLSKQKSICGDVLTYRMLQKGFTFKNKRVTLAGPTGIWKPKVFDRVPLSLRTSANGPYDDAIGDDDLLRYRYRGTDPQHPDNRGLREAMTRQIPLIYFFGILPGKYLAEWPVYIIGDDPDSLTFTVAVDDAKMLSPRAANNDMLNLSDDDFARRRYLTSKIKARVHQKNFRERVIQAYQEQCAFCRLRHTELLDAAHIIGDAEEEGEPIVPNGLALCKIHHAAFDANLIGITPDYQIKVREDILREKDGPMLRYGIQEMQDQKLYLPRQRELWPDPMRLHTRFDNFSRLI